MPHSHPQCQHTLHFVSCASSLIYVCLDFHKYYNVYHMANKISDHLPYNPAKKAWAMRQIYIYFFYPHYIA